MGIIDSIKKFFTGKKPRKESWEKINPEEEIKKITVKGNLKKGYGVFYNGGKVGGISPYDLKGFDSKTDEKKMTFFIYKLQTMHSDFKNRKLAEKIAGKMIKK